MELVDIFKQNEILRIENGLTRALIEGDVVPVSAVESHVFNNDNVIIQKISLVNGDTRTSAFKGYSVTWNVDTFVPTLNVTALLVTDPDGTEHWEKELTQEAEV
jgi:hypothetical protein